MNKDGTYTLPEAAQIVARLKTMMLSPYKVKGIAPSLKEGEPQPSKEDFMKRFKIEPSFVGRRFKNLTQILEAVRELHPEGEWLLMVTGFVPGKENPLAFLDTPIIEKAIEWHTSQGHGGGDI